MGCWLNYWFTLSIFSGYSLLVYYSFSWLIKGAILLLILDTNNLEFKGPFEAWPSKCLMLRASGWIWYLRLYDWIDVWIFLFKLGGSNGAGNRVEEGRKRGVWGIILVFIRKQGKFLAVFDSKNIVWLFSRSKWDYFLSFYEIRHLAISSLSTDSEAKS